MPLCYILPCHLKILQHLLSAENQELYPSVFTAMQLFLWNNSKEENRNSKGGLARHRAVANITHMKVLLSCRNNRNLSIKKNKEILYYTKERGKKYSHT